MSNDTQQQQSQPDTQVSNTDGNSGNIGTASGQNSNNDSQISSSQNPKETIFAKEEVELLIQKTRADEKNKVFKTIEDLKAKREEATNRIAALEKELQTAQSGLEELRAGKVSELKSVNEELAKLKESNLRLETSIKSVSAESELKIKQAKLDAYRAEQLRKHSVMPAFEVLVTGKEEADIDSAIKDVKKKEEELRKAIREDEKSKLSAELPTSLSIEGSHGRGPEPILTHTTRESVAHLKGEDYAKRRKEMLEQAKIKSAGQTS